LKSKIKKAGQHLNKLHIIIVAVIVGGIGSYLLFRSDAAVRQVKLPDVQGLNEETEIASNKILVKVKKSSLSKLKQDSKFKAEDSGIGSLNESARRSKAQKIEPVVPVKKGKARAAEKDQIYSWYSVTLNEKQQKVKIKDERSKSVKIALDIYRNDPNVEAVEPSVQMKISAVPNDPYYSLAGSWGQTYDDLWGLKKINAPAAWDVTTGSSSVVVADIDTGVDRNHPDIAQNMWVNTGEVQNNNIDDDGNGYVDDYYGWDFANYDNDPMDDNGHGTHTVGTIAASGNNSQGVVGVSWQAKIMALKFLDSSGSGYSEGGAGALIYAADNGARISSNSWGGGESQIVRDAVSYAHARNMVVVAAAGNNNSNSSFGTPSGAHGAINVAASGVNDQKACFSNWGEVIDVAAPGGDSDATWCGGQSEHILSLKSTVADEYFPNVDGEGRYTIARGTSMAAPHVSGLAVLILAKYPNATNEQVRQMIRVGADDLGEAGVDNNFGSGRINAARSISINPTSIPNAYISSPASGATTSSSNLEVIGTASGPGFASYKLELARINKSTRIVEPGDWTLVRESTSQVNSTVLGVINAASLSDGRYSIRLTVTDGQGKKYIHTSTQINLDNYDLQINLPLYKAAKAINNIEGFAATKNGVVFSRYKIEWGLGAEPTTWGTAGITLANNGQNQVLPGEDRLGGILGTIDTRNMANYQVISIKISLITNTGAEISEVSTVEIDNKLVAGWPKSFCVTAPDEANTYNYCGEERLGLSTLADITGDAAKEVVLTNANNRKVYAYNGSGVLLAGFPFSIPAVNETYADMYTPIFVNADDLNADGKQELILGAKTGVDSFGVFIINGDGTAYGGWESPTLLTSQNNLFGGAVTPAIADINNDGKKDVIVFDRPEIINDYNGDFAGVSRLNVYNLDGSQVAGFPKTFSHSPIPYNNTSNDPDYVFLISPQPYFAPPVVSDINNDGKNEIIWTISDQVFAFDNEGEVLPNWPVTVPRDDRYDSPAFANRKPVIAKFSGSSQNKSILVQAHYAEDWSATDKLYAYNFDGSIVSGWPVDVGWQYGGVLTGPATYDLNNDSVDEVVTFADSTGSSGRPMILRADGSKDQEFSDNYLNSGLPWPSEANPVIVDSNGDNTSEIGIIGLAHGPFDGVGLARPNGQKYWSTSSFFQNLGDRFNSAKTLYPSQTAAGNINTNSNLEFIQAVDIGNNQDWYGTDYNTSSIFVWRLPNPVNAANTKSWPQYGLNASLTSNLERNPDVEAPTIDIPGLANGQQVTGSVNVTPILSDNRAVARVEYWVDPVLFGGTSAAGAINKPEAPFDFAWDTTQLENGTRTLLVIVYDLAGNASAEFINVEVKNGDTTPPAKPTNLTATAISYSQVRLNWTPATDNVGIANNVVVRDEAVVAIIGNESTYTDTTATASTSYTYKIIAIDPSGNFSPWSDPVSVTTPAVPDTTKPSIPQTVKATAVSAGQINVTWQKSTDNVAIKNYDVYRGTTKIATVTTNSFGDTKVFGSTSYSYYVVARDTSNNVISKATVTITDNGVKHIYTAGTNGVYVIPGVPPKTYSSVKYSKSGYTSKTISITVPTGQFVTKNVNLSPL
jgi:subtilisin family serine protease/chitodextrinase